MNPLNSVPAGILIGGVLAIIVPQPALLHARTRAWHPNREEHLQ